MLEHPHIHGIVPPMTTPFGPERGLVDRIVRAETRYLIETARVHGLAVTGSTGEGHALTTDEVYGITAAVVDEARGRVPVITGIITDSTASAVERGLTVRDLGVAALQVTPVHYLFRPDDDAMVRHFDTLARRTGLPIIIYNVVPWTYLSPHLLARIIEAVPGVIGVKQSAGDMKLLADLLLLVGDRALGAHGAIAAILTAVPVLCVQLWDAVQAADHKQALALHEKLLPIWNAIAGDNLPANVKHCQALMGRPSGVPRAPMPATSALQADAIEGALRGAGLLR
jgi:4-hydroxy-tetrahydrodipicolinate synthase